MTAHDLIDSIFSRPSWGRGASTVRHITAEQLKYLRDLIGADPESHRARAGGPGSLVWMPAGRYKYVLTEDPTGGTKHTLSRLGGIDTSETGRLF